MEISLSEFKCIKDHVLVVPADPNDKLKLNGGSEIWLDTSWEPEKHAVLHGKVLAVPEKLHPRMKTTVEIKKYDEVFYSYLVEQNVDTERTYFTIADGIYRGQKAMLVNYESMYMALRDREWVEETKPYGLDRSSTSQYLTLVYPKGTPEEEKPSWITMQHGLPHLTKGERMRLKYLKDQQREVVMLNGYMLVEGIKEEKDAIGSIIIPDSVKKHWSEDFGVIRHKGTPLNDEFDEFEVGETIMLAAHADIPLENELHQAFGKGSRWYRVLRRDVEGVVTGEISR